MILAVNIGNTNISLGLYINPEKTIYTRFSKNLDIPLNTFINEFFSKNGISVSKIKGSVLASVVPEKTQFVAKTIEDLTGIKPIEVLKTMDFHLDLSNYDCSLIGIDRLICCMASYLKYKKTPFIVFDLGTSTTANVVDKDSNFLGGAILLGVQAGIEKLRGNGALLSSIHHEAKVKLIGQNTSECFQTGAVFSTCGFIESYAKKVSRALQAETSVILTGGNTEKILPYLETDFIYDANLLIDGLILLFKNLKREGFTC